ncbi:cAMP-dependent protein kinase regulatory subunit [Hondaea fermentalgiana]|uniref:cAMP-dependent protein kinase regulatory subunit n=1 Tax=Hondaea fermentalgiana TaxID=2315210 RepID=A0A2R5GJN1_9STRA|nr:cAMP-dependent protein kinase regulatory subunit [Hondaea fermentalgiana]|eukprot:GBG28491.1 cAMP-dependent protein kinase regulatory subunit [Hondaea fermentalgiana]
MWSRVRAAVKVASAIGHLNKESVGARRQRVRRNWDLARQIARAALSLSAITNRQAEADSQVGIKNYTRFIKLLDTHPASRSDADLDFMMASTSHLAIFSSKVSSFGKASVDVAASDVTVGAHLTHSQHREICRIMKMRTFKKSHEFIFHQGDTGEEFFIILEGSVLVQRDVDNSGVAHTVAKLEAGGSFGEIALSTQYTVRTAAVVTIEPCVLLVIHKDDYQRILQNTHQEVFDRKMRFLKSVPALQDLTDKEFFNLCISLHTNRARVGTSIMKEGDSLDPLRFFVIVKRGELEVRKLVAQSSSTMAKTTSKSTSHLGSIPKEDTAKNVHRATKVMTLCLMGPTESICDHQTLTSREDTSYKYPFTVVAKTLCEYYSISKHDLFGKLSRASLATVQQRISHFPSTRLLRNAFAVNRGWEAYKASLVCEILANKEIKGPAGFARLSPYTAPETGARLQSRLVDFEIARPRAQQNAQRRDSSTKAPRNTRASILNSSGKRRNPNRISCFERARRASSAHKAATAAGCELAEENSDETPIRKAYACVADVKDASRHETEAEPELLNAKRASVLAGQYKTLTSLERSKLRAKNREALRSRLKEGAHELDGLLADGFMLTRHVYENALSPGARFYCRSLAFWAEETT